MADETKIDPETLYCSTVGCKFTAKRGEVLKGCPKCGGKAFVDNLRKDAIEGAAASVAKAEEPKE